jgi:DNA-binding CsgD family transcriptional regulator
MSKLGSAGVAFNRANHPFGYLFGYPFFLRLRSLGLGMGREVGRAALSRREQEVAALVAEGMTNRAIAARMFISERTVDGHLEHIREKLGVSSRAQVAIWYVAQPPRGPVMAAAASPSRPRPASTLLLAIVALGVLTLGAHRLAATARARGPRWPFDYHLRGHRARCRAQPATVGGHWKRWLDIRR